MARSNRRKAGQEYGVNDADIPILISNFEIRATKKPRGLIGASA